jgi:hypothetical protein
VTSETLPLSTRLWFAFVCFFKTLFDPAFAAHVWSMRQAPALPKAPDRGGSRVALPSGSAATSPNAQLDAALRLLALFQREGRLVDFLQQDIVAFSDADVGAAARVVHEGCRKALSSHAVIEPVRSEPEGASVAIAAGFRPDEVKLLGEVTGAPPYEGILRHRGWRAGKFELPQPVGDHDTHVLAPAEVELE